MIANLIRNVNTNYRRHRTSRQVLLAAHDWRLLKLIVHMPEWISIRYGGTWSMSAQATCSWVYARAYEHDGRRSRLLSPCRWTIHNLTHQCIKHAHASARFSIDFRLIFQRLHALLFNSRHLQAIQLDFCWRIFMQYALSTRAYSFCREMEIVSSVHTQKENGAAMRDTNTHTHTRILRVFAWAVCLIDFQVIYSFQRSTRAELNIVFEHIQFDSRTLACCKTMLFTTHHTNRFNALASPSMRACSSVNVPAAECDKMIYRSGRKTRCDRWRDAA